MTRRLGEWFVVLVVSLLLPCGEAQASVNLPLHHWAYEAIERLTAIGVIDRAMVVPKPYGRKEAAKYVGRAIERVRANTVPLDGREAIAEPLLERLMAEFRPELRALGVLARVAGEKSELVRYGARLQTEFDAFSVGGGQTVRFRENRGGEYYANGEQNQTDVRGWVEVDDWAALTVQPKFISNEHVLGIGATNNNKNVYLREFSLKLSVFNIALEVGRGTLWWGPGYHGSLLLTDHAFPLDMIKLGSEEVVRLPWIFRELGWWKINTFLARLNSFTDQTGATDQAKLFGARVSWLPARWLELGATRLTQYGLAGQSFPQIIYDAYTLPPNQPFGPRKVHEQAMIDFRATIPEVPYLVPFPSGFQFYGEIGSRDKWSQLPLPSRSAILGGIYIPQVFSGDSMDLRIEYADTDLGRRRHPELTQVWYNDTTYVSGMRYRGFPLGHQMGTDAIDVFVRSTRYLTDDLQLGSNLNFQERGRGQPNHERKHEAEVDLTWWLSTRTQFVVGYTYQRLKNPGQISNINPFVETFAPGITATNHFLWTSLVMNF